MDLLFKEADRVIKKFKNNEQGVALVFTLLTFVVLSVLGIALMTIGVANVKLTKATTTHESTYYIAEGGVNQSLVVLEEKAMELGTQNLSHDEFFNQLDAFIDGNIKGELAIFEDNAGDIPVAVIDVTTDSTNEQIAGPYSERTVRYTLQSNGKQGQASRTVASSFDMTHRIKVASSGAEGVLDYLLYSGSNDVVNLIGDGYYEGDIYASHVDINAAGAEIKGNIVSENDLKIISNLKMTGDLISFGGEVNVAGANNTVNGNVHAKGDVTLSSGTKVKNIYTESSVVWGGQNTVDGEVHAQESIGTNPTAVSQVKVGSSVFAGKDVYTNSDNFTFMSDVHAGNNINLGAQNTIKGQAYAGNQIIGSGTIEGNRYTTPTAPTLPDYNDEEPVQGDIILTEFEHGISNLNINQTTTLEPGAYGEITFNGSSGPTLTSGDYYFKSLITVPNTGVTLDITDGPINVYITGDADFKSGFDVKVKKGNREEEMSRTFVTNHLDEAKEFAGDIYFETHGSFTLPENSTFIGSVIANNNFTTGSNTTLVGAFAVNRGKFYTAPSAPILYYAPPVNSAGNDFTTEGSNPGGELPPVEIGNVTPNSEE